MSIYGAQTGVPCDWSVSASCDQSGCNGQCPDFTIKRHDTQPIFKVSVEDCDGPVDFNNDLYVVEVSMWAKGKLKKALAEDDAYFALADNIGFDQMMVGDVIVMDRARLPEHMLVTAFDETNKYVLVERGYHGTPVGAYPKGNALRIFRMMGATAGWENQYADIVQADGTTAKDQLVASFLEYTWTANDTCLPGCYLLEFKLLKMLPPEEGLMFTALSATPSVIPSFTPSNMTPSEFGCGMPVGVDWVRRYPVDREGFLIQIMDSPTAEL